MSADILNITRANFAEGQVGGGSLRHPAIHGLELLSPLQNLSRSAHPRLVTHPSVSLSVDSRTIPHRGSKP